MDHSYIYDMVDALVDAGIVTDDTRKTAEKALEDHWATRSAVVWTLDDVTRQARQMHYVLGHEAKVDLLYRMADMANTRAPIGPKWAMLAEAIEECLDKKDVTAY